MNRLSKIICTFLTFSLLAGSTGFAAVRSDLKYSDAVSGAAVIDLDMIYETESNVTKQQLMNALFDYQKGSDNSVTSARGAYDADFTLYFGEEEPKRLTMFRTYVYGSDSEEINPPITVYGSNDGTAWVELAKISSPIKAAWNEETIDSDSAYNYVKVESAMSETQNEEIDDDGILKEEETNIHHQKITCAAFFEETENQESSGEGSTGTATAGNGNNAKFSDVQGHWAEAVIEKYTENGYISGYPDGTFRPDDGVTVSEFCRIVSAIQGINYTISTGSWALPYIREMMDKGIIERNDFADFDAAMTREQTAKAVLPLMTGEYYPKDLTQFEQYIADAGDITPAYREYVIKTYLSGVLSGYEDDSWRPAGGVTRAEILSVLDRVYNKDMREVPEAISGTSTASPEQEYYYNAAVQIRNTQNANSMQYRLYGSGAQYMEEDDAATGLKLFNEIQGAQGFAMVLRYDVSDIKEKREKLKKLYIEAQWVKNGTKENELGLWLYTYGADKTEWNNPLYYKNLNGSAVAGDDTAGYNSVVSNITATLPTWGNTTMAVPNEQKVAPLAHSPRTEQNKYVFDITDTVDEILAQANGNNMVEFFITTVNYDDYGQNDDKPQIYTAGVNAPKLHAEYDAGDSGIDYSGMMVKVSAEDAVLNGGALEREETDGIENIAYFVEGQEIVFTIDAPVEGDYLMRINSSASTSAGGTVRFTLNGESFDKEFPYGEGWAIYNYSDVGTVHLNKGENTLSITGVKWNATYLINIRDVVFEMQ